MLQKEILKNEKLARIICASRKQKKYQKKIIYDADNDNWNVQVSVFLDDRNPSEISVNKITTLDLENSHYLGLEHKNEKQPELKYYGFAQINASICYEQNCIILQDDLKGLKPYHANIIYPEEQNTSNHDIATTLAFISVFEKYDGE